MTSSFEYGYLETDYLVFPYAAGVVETSLSSQIEFKIQKEQSILSQIDQKILSLKNSSAQIDTNISGKLFTGSSQIEHKIFNNKSILGQISNRLQKSKAVGTQFDRNITSIKKSTKVEMGRGWILHTHCGGYLLNPYATEPYLGDKICAHLFSQIKGRLSKHKNLHGQIEHRITKHQKYHSQIKHKIFSSKHVHAQIKRVNAYKLNAQLTIAIYNTTNLRILYEFPSRGTSGTNWNVISGGTAAGDFGINNVNTDLVEQVYRSTATSISIQCDTQITQGVFNDTLAILGHNLTRSATVQMLASNSVTFATVGLDVNLSVETENIYWISPSLPFNSYRYWRFQISDVSNPFGFLQLGTIVFGSSIIFSGECFVDEVTRRKTHFADRIKTEGYSSVSNDRALKRAVSLTFRRLNYNYNNYPNLVKVIDATRTSLKSLWIPAPQFSSRFAVFGKLSEIPVENHKVISKDADYIDLDITVDEAL